jgi:hypothetical protein
MPAPPADKNQCLKHSSLERLFRVCFRDGFTWPDDDLPRVTLHGIGSIASNHVTHLIRLEPFLNCG